MTFLAFLVTATLMIPSALHLLWAIGHWTPIRDEAALTRAVVGAPGLTRMPGAIACAVVSMALLFVALLPHLSNFPAQKAILQGAAGVFLLRGVAAYLPVWRKRLPEQPFATLDVRLYGPLCLFVGASLLILSLKGA